MNVLLTGASGGLGRKLVEGLTAREDLNPRVLVHRSPVSLQGLETVEGDLQEPETLRRAVSGIDCVLHLAALTHARREEDYFSVNVTGTKNLIQACAAEGVKRFIFISSRAAHPQGGAYAESKWQAEECVRESGIPWVILRPAEIYGPGSNDAINQLVRWVRNRMVIPVIGNGQYRLSPVFADDVVSPMLEALAAGGIEGRCFILAGPEELTFTDLIDRLCRYFKVRRVKIFIPVWLARWGIGLMVRLGKGRLARDQIPRLLCPKSADIGPAVERLNFNPRPLEAGLASLGSAFPDPPSGT